MYSLLLVLSDEARKLASSKGQGFRAGVPVERPQGVFSLVYGRSGVNEAMTSGRFEAAVAPGHCLTELF